MAKKHKHTKAKKVEKRRDNLSASLQEGLHKYWTQQRWDAFVTLFLRQQGKALLLPEAQLLDAALWNCLTDALFIRRDMVAVAMAVGLVLSPNGDILPFSEETRHCAAVARSVLEWQRTGQIPQCVAPQSAPYAALLAYMLASPCPASAVINTQSNSKAYALLMKMASQYAALPTAKTATAYTHWQKNADALAQLLPEEPVFQALAALVRTGRLLKDKHGPLRNPEDAIHALMQACHQGYEGHEGTLHPGMSVIVNFLVHTGQTLYGEQWALAIQVGMASLLVSEETFTAREKNQITTFHELSRNTQVDTPSTLFAAMLSRRDLWNDREYFLLGSLWLHRVSEGMQEDTVSTEKILQVVERLILLVPLFFPGQPAPSLLVKSLEVAVALSSRPLAAACMPLLRLFPPRTLIALQVGLLRRKKNCNIDELARNGGHTLPVRLSTNDTEHIAKFLLGAPRHHISTVCALLTKENQALLCEYILRIILDKAIECDTEEAELHTTYWRMMNGHMRDFFLAHLSEDSIWRALLTICGDKPFTLVKTVGVSADFVRFVMAQHNPLGVMRLLCQWQGVSLGLFMTLYEALEDTIFTKKLWPHVFRMLEDMPITLMREVLAFLIYRWGQKKCKDRIFKELLKWMRALADGLKSTHV